MKILKRSNQKYMRFAAVARRLKRLDAELDENRSRQGRMLTLLVHQIESSRIQDYEFKVFSQWLGGEHSPLTGESVLLGLRARFPAGIRYSRERECTAQRKRIRSCVEIVHEKRCNAPLADR